MIDEHGRALVAATIRRSIHLQSLSAAAGHGAINSGHPHRSDHSDVRVRLRRTQLARAAEGFQQPKLMAPWAAGRALTGLALIDVRRGLAPWPALAGKKRDLADSACHKINKK
jgi:hypothetical protein